MMWLIIGGVALALFLLLCFAFGIKDAVLMTYFVIKSILLHLLEWTANIIAAMIFALFRFDIALLFFVILCVACYTSFDKNVMVVLYLLFMFIFIKCFADNLRECFYYKPFHKYFTLADKWLSFGNLELHCFEDTKWY